MKHRFSVHRLFIVLVALWPWAAQAQQAQTVEVAQVTARKLERVIMLPGELQPYQAVTLHARVAGFVDQVDVDRGSAVKKGQLLVKLVAPEIAAQVAEANSKLRAAEAQRAQAVARLAAVQSVSDQLKAASATQGAISGRELIQAQKEVEAAQALVDALQSAVVAAESSLNVAKQMEQYLSVTAPFDGIITERMVHPGALVGPAGAGTGALLELEQIARLRLVVAVPEAEYTGIVTGAEVPFTVPAYKTQKFTGIVARLSGSVDPKTRSMLVELDVKNPAGVLAPGMYPEVSWPVRRPSASLLVPTTSLVTTTERTFVIRVTNGRAEWVDVKRGVSAGTDLVEVTGKLQAGDTLVRRGTDELREGTPIQPQAPPKGKA
jgi:membrane fusion protein (multidrug efflux system)